MRTTTRTRRAFTTLFATAVLAAAAAGCAGSGSGRSAARPSALDSIDPAATAAGADFDSGTDGEPERLASSATDPADAVRRYLAAEQADQPDASYGALSSASRTRAGSLDDWREGTLQRPTVVGFQVDDVPDLAPRAEATIVRGDVTLEPRLDEVGGFVPHHADAEWKVVAEDGGWRLDLTGSSLAPRLPDEGRAAAAAERWAAARQECRTEGEYDGSLLGSPVLAEQLCGLPGELVAGPPMALDEALTTSVVAAFGPDAVRITRTVELHGASDLAVVTAPFGDDWVVVGVTG